MQKDIAQNLEGKLHFKSQAEVEEERHKLAQGISQPHTDPLPIKASTELSHVKSQLEQGLHFKTRWEVQNQQEKMTRSSLLHSEPTDQQKIVSGSIDHAIKAKLEKDLHFKTNAMVQEEQLRHTKTEDLGHVQAPAAGLVDTAAIKKQLESQIMFKSKEVVEEMREKLAAIESSIRPRRRSIGEGVKQALELNLHFKTFQEVQEQRAKLTDHLREQGDIKHLLEKSLHFKSQKEVEEERARIARKTDEAIKKKLEADLKFKTPQELHQIRRKSLKDQSGQQDNRTFYPEDIKALLEQELKFKPHGKVVEQQDKLTKGESNPAHGLVNIRQVQHELEKALKFKSAQEVESKRTQLTAHDQPGK